MKAIMENYYGSKAPYDVSQNHQRPFHPDAAPHFVPLCMLLPLTYNECLTFRLLYMSARDSGMAKYACSTSPRRGLGKQCKDIRGLLRWQVFHLSSSHSLDCLNCRCLSAEVFRHNAALYPVLDQSGQLYMNCVFQGGRCPSYFTQRPQENAEFRRFLFPSNQTMTDKHGKLSLWAVGVYHAQTASREASSGENKSSLGEFPVWILMLAVSGSPYKDNLGSQTFSSELHQQQSPEG